MIKKRAYIDGVWDLFHIGHLKLFKKIKKKFGHLIVGIHPDKLVANYKRKPIIPHKDRIEIIKSIKYVDEVIENAPFLTLDLIKKHDIEAVATTNTTSFSCDTKDKCALEKLKIFYEFRSSKYHTSDIIKRIKYGFLTEKKLLKVIKLIKDQGDKSDKFYKIGLEISDINENLYMAIDTLLDSFFNKEKTETLYWFIYENPSLPCIYAIDSRKVLYDFRKKGDLWRYLND